MSLLLVSIQLNSPVYSSSRSQGSWTMDPGRATMVIGNRKAPTGCTEEDVPNWSQFNLFKHDQLSCSVSNTHCPGNQL